MATLAERELAAPLAATVSASLGTETYGQGGSSLLLDMAQCFRTTMATVWGEWHVAQQDPGGAAAGRALVTNGVRSKMGASTSLVVDPLAYRIPYPACAGV